MRAGGQVKFVCEALARSREHATTGCSVRMKHITKTRLERLVGGDEPAAERVDGGRVYCYKMLPYE